MFRRLMAGLVVAGCLVGVPVHAANTSVTADALGLVAGLVGAEWKQTINPKTNLVFALSAAAAGPRRRTTEPSLSWSASIGASKYLGLKPLEGIYVGAAADAVATGAQSKILYGFAGVVGYSWVSPDKIAIDVGLRVVVPVVTILEGASSVGLSQVIPGLWLGLGFAF